MFEIPEDIKEAAYEAAGAACTNTTVRTNGGDVYAGAMAAGADSDTARDIAVQVHMHPELRKESALLLLGATKYLASRSEDG